jgi:hypothetical protein
MPIVDRSSPRGGLSEAHEAKPSISTVFSKHYPLIAFRLAPLSHLLPHFGYGHLCMVESYALLKIQPGAEARRSR